MMAAGPRIVKPTRDFLGLFNTEIEARVLGTVMRDAEAYEYAAELQPGDFGVEAHRRIWIAVQKIAADIHPNVGNVYESLGSNLEAAGGLSGLIELTAQAVEPILLKRFVNEIKKYSAERRQARLGLKINEYLELGDIEGAKAAAQAFLENDAQPSGRFTIADIKPIEEYGNTEITYIFKALLIAGTVNVMTGEPGCGKSSLADYIASVVSEERDVLYCDRENNIAVVSERHGRMGIKDGGRFKYMGLWSEVEPWDPASPELIAWVRQCDPKPLLIFDSGSAYFTGDENSAADMRIFFEPFRRLSAMGATILLLHHSGKGVDTKDYRGSSDLKASIDSGWHLSNFGEGRLGRMRLRAWKCRYAVATDLVMDYAGGRFLFDERPDAPARSSSDHLTALLRQNPGLTQTGFETIATKALISRAVTRSFLENGVLAHTIVAEPGAKRAMHYSLAVGESHA